MTLTSRSRITGPTLSLMAFCIALNVSMGQITALLKVPLYLDMLGTILCAALAGPLPSVITAISSNILAAPLGSPAMIFFIPVGVVVALISSGFAAAGAFHSRFVAAGAGVVQGIVAATVSAPIAAFVFGGVTFAGTDLLVALFRGSGFSILQSVWLQGLVSDTVDKSVSYFLVASVVSALPFRLLFRFRPALQDPALPPTVDK